MDLARIFRHDQRGPEDAQLWGESYHKAAQQDPKLALWCPDPLVTTGVMASLQEFHPDRDTDELDSLDLEATACHGNLRGAVWRKASASGLLLPAFEQIVLPHPQDLGTEQQGDRLVILGPDGRPAAMWVEEAVAKAARRPQVVVPEMPLPEVAQVKPKAPKPPLPQSKHERIKAAMASPVLGLGTAPAGRNLFAKATEVPGPGPWWWQEQERNRKKAEAAADKRIAEREQKQALERAKKPPSTPQVPSKDDDLPDVGGRTPGISRRKL